MICLLDGDICVYRCGFAAEKKHKKELPDGDVEHTREVEPLSHALQNVDTLMDGVTKGFDSTEVYLTGKGNFREKVATILPYKGNRSKFAKPFYYEEIRQHLIDKYKAVVIEGMEADDAMGLRQTEGKEKTCITTIDKDLDQIPGQHYNWVKNERYQISELDGLRRFYGQLLTGDRVDNIPGIYGVGPVTATKLLAHAGSELHLWQAVRRKWFEHYPRGYEGRSVDEVLLEVGRLLWIRRTGREQWYPIS